MSIFSKVTKAIHEGGVRLLTARTLWSIKKTLGFNSKLVSFAQPMMYGLPEVDFVVQRTDFDVCDIEFAKRIITAYKKTLQDKQKQPQTNRDDVWSVIEREEHRELFALLEVEDAEGLAKYMHEMHTKSVTYGVSDLSEVDYRNISKYKKKENASLIKDRIVCLAEAVGAISYRYFDSAIYSDTDKLVESIKKTLGINIAPPEIDNGLIKLRAGGMYFSLRDLYAVYTAWRVKGLVGSSGTIAEIGAGLGKTALYSGRFGIKDYSIYDLPQMNVVQAWYLLKSGVEVSLYGETLEQDSVKVLPWWEFGKSKIFDLTLNVDSFAEMSPEIVEDYLKKIKSNTRKYLLSVNHEKEHVPKDIGDTHETSLRIVVPEYIKKSHGYILKYRFPFWMRQGYIEELYSIDKCAAPTCK